MGKVNCEAVTNTDNSRLRIRHEWSIPTLILPGIGAPKCGHPLDSFSKTNSIVTLSLRRLAVFASRNIVNAGFIAEPFPIPGRPTRTTNRLG